MAHPLSLGHRERVVMQGVHTAVLLMMSRGVQQLLFQHFMQPDSQGQKGRATKLARFAGIVLSRIPFHNQVCSSATF